ncbi:hypothetical protein AB1Y20_000067 [Prymnesium parvum]|uniref:Uncharacterized protein n=1 Tax=Prymnesium parvum TaxID=97485 RepID=A0AB34K732_PRYPA
MPVAEDGDGVQGVVVRYTKPSKSWRSGNSRQQRGAIHDVRKPSVVGISREPRPAAGTPWTQRYPAWWTEASEAATEASDVASEVSDHTLSDSVALSDTGKAEYIWDLPVPKPVLIDSASEGATSASEDIHAAALGGRSSLGTQTPRTGLELRTPYPRMASMPNEGRKQPAPGLARKEIYRKQMTKTGRSRLLAEATNEATWPLCTGTREEPRGLALHSTLREPMREPIRGASYDTHEVRDSLKRGRRGHALHSTFREPYRGAPPSKQEVRDSLIGERRGHTLREPHRGASPSKHEGRDSVNGEGRGHVLREPYRGASHCAHEVRDSVNGDRRGHATHSTLREAYRGPPYGAHEVSASATGERHAVHSTLREPLHKVYHGANEFCDSLKGEQRGHASPSTLGEPHHGASRGTHDVVVSFLQNFPADQLGAGSHGADASCIQGFEHAFAPACFRSSGWPAGGGLDDRPASPDERSISDDAELSRRRLPSGPCGPRHTHRGGDIGQMIEQMADPYFDLNGECAYLYSPLLYEISKNKWNEACGGIEKIDHFCCEPIEPGAPLEKGDSPKCDWAHDDSEWRPDSLCVEGSDAQTSTASPDYLFSNGRLYWSLGEPATNYEVDDAFASSPTAIAGRPTCTRQTYSSDAHPNRSSCKWYIDLNALTI